MGADFKGKERPSLVDIIFADLALTAYKAQAATDFEVGGELWRVVGASGDAIRKQTSRILLG
jgi:hypothetical protein